LEEVPDNGQGLPPKITDTVGSPPTLATNAPATPGPAARLLAACHPAACHGDDEPPFDSALTCMFHGYISVAETMQLTVRRSHQSGPAGPRAQENEK